jgi:DNA repair protein RecO (recombination protein O)
VLRARPLGEADRILTLFTDERGKIDAVAKGIRRAKSHFAGRLEFGNECELTMHAGRSLDVIVSAEIARAPWQRLVDPDRFTVASFVAEVIDALCEPDLALPDVYALISATIGAIASSDAPRTIVPRFSWRLLEMLGLRPPFDACIRCSNALDGRAWVDPNEGGLICERCRERWRELLQLGQPDLANLSNLAAPRDDPSATMQARPAVASAIETILAYHLGRKPKVVV